jgi:hypothetical protein
MDGGQEAMRAGCLLDRGDRGCLLFRQAEWAVPSRRADQGRDCGAAEIQRIAQNAPHWSDVKLVTAANGHLEQYPIG